MTNHQTPQDEVDKLSAELAANHKEMTNHQPPTAEELHEWSRAYDSGHYRILAASSVLARLIAEARAAARYRAALERFAKLSMFDSVRQRAYEALKGDS